ncbi:hypothetical protein EV191_106275 [Tamaricihabitans halophyticus]|uniref:Uncharacterized protein n=1 Tax=Tamaricihabitans halophyticus TaxID=1262583 RepID=A0A4R2QT06_9PSEU|nr:hypothetical protein [Tamaricihabitans halophyticus]TCP52109.1 hypothetical protein EV191_106275 [Tamaricihabitans halophyticus]
MASLFGKLARLASSPQGRMLLRKAKDMANDPRKRQQAKDALDKVRKKYGNGGDTGQSNPPQPRG